MTQRFQSRNNFLAVLDRLFYLKFFQRVKAVPMILFLFFFFFFKGKRVNPPKIKLCVSKVQFSIYWSDLDFRSNTFKWCFFLNCIIDSVGLKLKFKMLIFVDLCKLADCCIIIIPKTYRCGLYS